MSESESKYIIKIDTYKGDEFIRQEVFRRDLIKIGRSKLCNLCIDDPVMDDEHVVVNITSLGDILLDSLGHHGTTRLNGTPVRTSDLQSGDTVDIGQYKLVFSVERPGQKGLKAEAQIIDKNSVMSLELAMFWGDSLLSVDNFLKPKEIIVGESKKVDKFFVPNELLKVDEYPLIQIVSGKWGVNLSNPHFGGDILVGDSVMSVEEYKEQYSLVNGSYLIMEPHIKCRLTLAHIAFLITYSPLPPMPKVSFLKRVNWREMIYMIFSVIMHLTFITIMNLIPEEQLKAKRDPHAKKNKLLATVVQSQQEEEEDKQEIDEDEDKDEDKDKEKEKEKPNPDKVKVQPDKNVKVKIQTKSKLMPNMNKAQAKKLALNTGATAAFSQQTDLISDLMGSGAGDWGAGSTGMKVIGSAGAGGGMFGGGGGLDPFGGGLGGGGGGSFRGTATTYGVYGGGGGFDGLEKTDADDIKVGFKKKNQKLMSVVSGDMSVKGQLDKATIRKYISRHMAQIKWCYQKELQKDPKLKGKVTVRFTISPTGDVLKPAVKDSSVNNNNLHACLTNKIKRWKFPSPKGGGIVVVNYPFIFKTK